ncbi:MAG TPA: FAD-binding protein [Actinomycetota bacterium]|nr:FAD-binding protein [Actinomycetota bacterium]
MDLIHPTSSIELVEAVRDSNDRLIRLLIVGGRRHLDKGNASDADAELWTTQLDRLVAYHPSEMIAVVEAGMRIGELSRLVADGGQEWPSDAPEDATVGGVIASGASSARRLRMGPLRDTVLEAEVVTGDGRLVRSGARTVKNVTGYDLHKLVAGSLGTLGVIARVAIKVRPLPRARRTLRFDDDLGLARELLGAVPSAAAVLAMPGEVQLRLEGWPEEVEEETAQASSVSDPTEIANDEPFPSSTPWDAKPIVAEVAVPPSKLDAAVTGEAWGALAGVGIAWVGLDDAGGLDALRERVRAAGGIAPVIRGAGGLGHEPVAATAVQRNLKEAFDPNEILAPGRGWAA